MKISLHHRLACQQDKLKLLGQTNSFRIQLQNKIEQYKTYRVLAVRSHTTIMLLGYTCWNASNLAWASTGQGARHSLAINIIRSRHKMELQPTLFGQRERMLRVTVISPMASVAERWKWEGCCVSRADLRGSPMRMRCFSWKPVPPTRGRVKTRIFPRCTCVTNMMGSKKPNQRRITLDCFISSGSEKQTRSSKQSDII